MITILFFYVFSSDAIITLLISGCVSENISNQSLLKPQLTPEEPSVQKLWAPLSSQQSNRTVMRWWIF